MELNIKSLDKKLKDNITRFEENLGVFDKVSHENDRIKKDLADSYNRFSDLSEQLSKMIINFEEQQKIYTDEVNLKQIKFENKIDEQIRLYYIDNNKKMADFKQALDEEIKYFNENMELLKSNNSEEFERFNINISSMKESILDGNKKYDEKFNKVHITMEVMDKELKRVNDSLSELSKKVIEEGIIVKDLQIKLDKNFRNGIIISSLITLMAVIIVYFMK